MRKWTDEKIKEWNLKTFDRDVIRQLNKVEEELLEVEKAKRGVFCSQVKNYNQIYTELADAYIASVGLSTYDDFLALSRCLKNSIYPNISCVLDPFIDEKMEENVKRKFVKMKNVDHHV